MCKYLRSFISERDGETKHYCEARGTAYCKMSMLEYPEYAISKPETCKDYEKERLIKGNKDGVALSNEPVYLDDEEVK